MDEKRIEFIKMLDSELPSIQLPGQFYTKDRISNNQLYGALTTYARGVNPNSVIGLSDPTDELSGKEGILFSTSAVYFSDADMPNGKHGFVMIMYRDITSAEASGKLLNASIEISVKNLPFPSVVIKDMTINMESLVSVIEHIIKYVSDDYECESDRSTSLSAVNYFIHKREKIMYKVYSSIKNNETIPKEYCSCTDGLGLSPLHYCLLLGHEALAVSIAKESAKYYKDIYIDGQPTGLYNYCFMAAYRDLRDAFAAIYECSTAMEPIMAQRKKQNIKQGVIKVVDFGLDFIPGSGLIKAGKKGGKLLKKGMELADNSVVRAGIDMARTKVENDGTNSLYDDDLTHEMWFMCKESVLEIKNEMPEYEDPRYRILYGLYTEKDGLRRRIESDNRQLVCWNKKYLSLTDYEIVDDPAWSEFIVEG